jgi:hypothetical protein
MFHGKIHYRWWFSVVMLNCQRVVNQGVDYYWTLGGWDYQPKKSMVFAQSKPALLPKKSPVPPRNIFRYEIQTTHWSHVRVSEVMQIPSRLHGCFNTKIFGHPWLGWWLGVPPRLRKPLFFFPRMQKFLSPLFLLWAPSGHVELLEIQQWPTCLIETSICKWECSLPANFFVFHITKFVGNMSILYSWTI